MALCSCNRCCFPLHFAWQIASWCLLFPSATAFRTASAARWMTFWECLYTCLYSYLYTCLQTSGRKCAGLRFWCWMYLAAVSRCWMHPAARDYRHHRSCHGSSQRQQHSRGKICRDMDIDMCRCFHVGMCIYMCIGMHIGMCMDIGMYMHVYRRVYRHGGTWGPFSCSLCNRLMERHMYRHVHGRVYGHAYRHGGT